MATVFITFIVRCKRHALLRTCQALASGFLNELIFLFVTLSKSAIYIDIYILLNQHSISLLTTQLNLNTPCR